MAPTNAERFQAKRQAISQVMAQEEQQAGAFSQLREGYHKMLLSRFSFRTAAGVWKRAHTLACVDYLRRIDEMRALYVQANGDASGFQAPKMYYLVKADFNPLNAEILRLDTEAAPAESLRKVIGNG